MISRYKSIPITDVSYYNMLCNKRVAIVGPSCNTQNTKQGKKIDNYDIVVRLNKSIPIPRKRYNDIGSRTDILYNSMNTSDFPGQNNINIPLLQKENIKYIACSYPYIYPFDKDISKFLSINNNRIPYHIPHIILYKTIVSILQCRPYTGTCAILDILNFPVKELYITGIDCYLNKYYKEYRQISREALYQIRHNHIHQNGPQLDFIKTLALKDSRLRLDKFLENYFFRNEYKIYKSVNTNNYIFDLDNVSEININFDKKIYYGITNISNNNFITIRDSMNYLNLLENADIYFNFNSKNEHTSININNDIKILFDFNNNNKVIQKIKEHTDIEKLYIITDNFINQFLRLSYFKKINYRFIVINLILKLTTKMIYIDNKILNDFSKEEMTFCQYLQHLQKITFINI